MQGRGLCPSSLRCGLNTGVITQNGVYVFKFILGSITGLFLSMVLFSTMTIFDVKIDLSIVTNIIIAIATVVATVIHFDSQKKQRLDRIWDINKGVLLDLTHSLSEVIEATEIELQNRYSYNGERIETKPYVWSNLDEKINYMLNVYGSLVRPNLLSAINHHRQIDREISRQVDQEDLDISEAYETLLNEHKILYKQLLSFIAEISGVNRALIFGSSLLTQCAAELKAALWIVVSLINNVRFTLFATV